MLHNSASLQKTLMFGCLCKIDYSTGLARVAQHETLALCYSNRCVQSIILRSMLMWYICYFNCSMAPKRLKFAGPKDSVSSATDVALWLA